VTDQVWLLVIGFLLTSVLGGGLGYLFQSRAWSHQHDLTQRDYEREQALKTFEEVSARMDKRLYRMNRLYWAAAQRSRGADNQSQWDGARADHTSVLYEWNDNLNRSLALVQTHFGGATRQELEDGVYEEFATLGRAMTHVVRGVAAGTVDRPALSRMGRRLGHLSRRVYDMNVRMLGQLEEGTLGRQAPTEHATPHRDEQPILELGAHGPAVVRLQERLRAAGRDETPVDGDFGPNTQAAVLELQRSTHLAPDGVVGPGTWAVLTGRLEASD
jgi:hypothetical protein